MRTIEWRQPSRSEAAQSVEAESVPIFRNAESVEEAVEQPDATVAGSAMRGTILHKLMEEVLNGETDDSVDTLAARALELMAQLSVSPSDHPSAGISPDELARTVVRTLSIPEISGLRPRLIPEYAINGSRMDADREIIVSGIADAIACDDGGRIETVVDWKSDVALDAERLNSYYGQLDVYRHQTGARNALLVLMTAGTIVAI
jgi:PD-(D/E)XK nuclease superfamily